jgi:pSer/pThr/pTyr-binding forkhead associated (FHA) protein/tetratricopeptide (TPR) repeat protein
MIVLTAFRDGRLTGRIEAGEDLTVTIGRAETSTLVLEGDAVSREHCRLAFADGAWTLFDADSRGGIFVAGERLTSPRLLADGEAFEVADYHVVARITAQGGGAAPDRTEFRPRPVLTGEGQNAVEILSGPGQGAVRRFGDRLLIGRSTRCDLVIDDPTVSREHLLIEFRDGRFTAANQNARNITLKNGAAIQKDVLANGDVLTIGPAEVRLTLGGQGRQAAGGGLAARLTRHPKLLAAAGIGLFLLIAGIFFLSSPAPSPRDAVIEGERAKEQDAQDAEYMRKVMTLLIQARRLSTEGQDEQALARLTALLEIDSGNEEARRLQASIKDKLAARDAEAQARRQEAETAREAAAPHVAEAERLLARGDTAGARQAVDQALAVAADLPEARGLVTRIGDAEAAARRAIEEKARTAAQGREHLIGLYDEAAAALAANEGYRALTIYRRLAEEETEPARAEAARKKAAEIQDALVKRIMPDFTQGQKLYAQKKYGEAFKIWTRVLDIYPEAKETRAKVAELTPMLEAEAKRLYEEGLVYQGLGNYETAKARWREALEAMPLPDNEYHRRAAEKLGLAAPSGGTP